MLQALLVDVDSKIPNLALMKLSHWLRDQGFTPTLFQMHGHPLVPLQAGFFHAWISCVFSWNKNLAHSTQRYYESIGVPSDIGGSGVSLVTKLPERIESLAPDYSLYKDDRAVGFVQRGCIRKCEFCIVPQKEGRLAENPYMPLETWVPASFKKVLLLDNEFAACYYEKQVLDSVRQHGWKLSITQGYDLRCVTPEKAALLAGNKPYDLKFREKRLYCAWDYLAIEPYVRQGIERLLKAGFKGREIMCYCLVGFNSNHAQDYYRFWSLWKQYGVLPFFMRYNLRKDDRFLNALSRYVNRGPAGYRNHSFIEYCKYRATYALAEAETICPPIEHGEHPGLMLHKNVNETRGEV